MDSLDINLNLPNGAHNFRHLIQNWRLGIRGYAPADGTAYAATRHMHVPHGLRRACRVETNSSYCHEK